MFSAKELAANINKMAHFHIHGLTVEVQILDARRVFDRVDYLIQPTKGSGQSWVHQSSVRMVQAVA